MAEYHDQIISDLQDQIEQLRALGRHLYEALATCRPWIDDFEDGDLALFAWKEFHNG